MSRKPERSRNLSAGPHRRRKLLVASLVIVLSASFAAYYFVHLEEVAAPAQVKTASGSTQFIIQNGTSITVSDGSFRYVQFNITTYSSITGGFSASEGITMYILYSSDATSLNSHGVPNSYVYTTGHVSSKTFSTNLKPGTYDLMLANDNGYNSASVVTFTAGVQIIS